MAVFWGSHHHLHSADSVSEWDYIDKNNDREQIYERKGCTDNPAIYCRWYS